MITKEETNKRKIEAKEYLDKVVDQMVLADSDLKDILKSDIGSLIDQCLEYGYLGKSFEFSADPELEQIVNEALLQLQQDIFNIIYLRAENASTIGFEKEKEDYNDAFLLAFFALKIGGYTIQEKIDFFTGHVSSEVEAYVAAGISKGWSRDKILNEYLNNLKKPYNSGLIQDAMKEGGFRAERIKNKGVTFGVGRYVSSFNNLKRLDQVSIFGAYNYTVNSIWMNNNDIVGWYTVRGSSYPCSICDMEVGMFHSKNEFFYGYHERCVCIMIPVFKSDM